MASTSTSSATKARIAYGLAYGDVKNTRLAGIKAQWDPTNVFRGNQNIKPA